MMAKEEADKILEYLDKNDIMLEWGSGGSTAFFGRKVKKYYSIEHNKKWFDKVKQTIIGLNIELYLIPNNEKRTKPIQRHQFQDYIDAVHYIYKFYDKVLIDGRARKWCAIEVIPYLKKDAVVFVHDFYPRPHYHDILDFYEEIDSQNTLAVLQRI